MADLKTSKCVSLVKILVVLRVDGGYGSAK